MKESMETYLKQNLDSLPERLNSSDMHVTAHVLLEARSLQLQSPAQAPPLN